MPQVPMAYVHVEKLLSATGAPILVHNQQGEIINATASAAQLLEYELDEIKQLVMANVLPKTLRFADICEDQKKEYAPVIFQKRSGKRFSARTWLLNLLVDMDHQPQSLVLLEFNLVEEITYGHQPGPQVEEDLAILFDFFLNKTHEYAQKIRTCNLSENRDDAKQVIDIHALGIEHYSKYLSDLFYYDKGNFHLNESPFNLIEFIDALYCQYTSEYGLSLMLPEVDTDVPELVFGDEGRLRLALDAIFLFVLSQKTISCVHISLSVQKNQNQVESIEMRIEFNWVEGASSLNHATQGFFQTCKKTLEIFEKIFSLIHAEFKYSVDVDRIRFHVNTGLKAVHRLNLSKSSSFLSGQTILIDSRDALFPANQLKHWGARLIEVEGECAAWVDSLQKLDTQTVDGCLLVLSGHSSYADLQDMNNKISACGFSDCWVMVTGGVGTQALLHAPFRFLEYPTSVGRWGNQMAMMLDKVLPYPFFESRRVRLEKKEALRKRILFVGLGNEEARIQSFLDSFDYEVDVAHNGIDAIVACSERQYQLIFINVLMPFMDGYETAAHIRKNILSNQGTPIIGLCDDVSSNALIACQHVDIHHLLLLPVDQASLLEVMNSIEQGRDVSFSDSFSKIQKAQQLKRRGLEASSSDEKPGEHRVVNLDHVSRLVKETSLSSCKELVRLFLDETAVTMTAIESDIEQQDFVSLTVQAHTLKSASLTFGCEELFDLSNQLETSANQRHIQACTTIYGRLVPSLNQCSITLDKFFNQLSNTLKSG